MSDMIACEHRLEELESRLRLLEDVEAIRQLHYQYSRTADERRWDEFVECFAEDCQGDYEPFAGQFSGKADVKRFIDEAIPGRLGLIIHYSTDPIIAVNGNEASGLWNFITPCTMFEDAEEKPVWQTGQYKVVYKREHGHWKIWRIRCSFFFVCDHDKGWVREKIKVLGAASKPPAE